MTRLWHVTVTLHALRGVPEERIFPVTDPDALAAIKRAYRHRGAKFAIKPVPSTDRSPVCGVLP
jgi:hypothetical protein